MIHFEWPWLLLALPFPLLIHWIFPPALPEEQAALKVPFLDDFGVGETKSFKPQRQRWPLILAMIAWSLLVCASARPQWMGEPIEQAVNGRDLMLAIDLSGSMEAEDFMIGNKKVDRLSATKQVASEFIQRRAGDRIGLILFGSQAYLQTPLTFDRTTIITLLNEAAIGLAGESTAIGDAIGLGVKRLKEQSADSRILILLTDGANTAGEVTPIRAAEIAAEYGLKIYTIGIGADEMIVRTFFGRQKVNPSRDLDEKTLKTIAEKTGGQYFRARDTQELEKIYSLLDELEPVEKEHQFFRPKKSLYHWPLALAFLLAGVIGISRLRLS
jgi:Ca-activated chloride channel family protein